MTRRLPILPLLLTLAAWLALPAPASARQGTVVFRMSDPAMDDTGAGTYRYPTGAFFRDNPGMFDLRDFAVIDEGALVALRLEFKGRIPKSVGGNGFSNLLVDIYVDRDHRFGSGVTRALAGRHVRFKPEEAWDRCILITPVRDTLMEEALREKTEDLEMANLRERVLIPAVHTVDTYTLTVKVDKSKLGQPEEGWGYQVLVLGFDPEDREPTTFYNLEVKAFPGESHFGGGADDYGDPNVIDCLAPEGTTQRAFLSAYRSHPNPALASLAYVPMCYSARGAFMKTARDEMKSPIPVAAKPTTPAGSEDDFLARLRLERDTPPDEPEGEGGSGDRARVRPLPKPDEVAVVESRVTPSGSSVRVEPKGRPGKPAKGKAAPAEPLAARAEAEYAARLAELAEGGEEIDALPPASRAAAREAIERARKAAPPAAAETPAVRALIRDDRPAKPGLRAIDGFDPQLAGYLAAPRGGADAALAAAKAHDPAAARAARAPGATPRKTSLLDRLRDRRAAAAGKGKTQDGSAKAEEIPAAKTPPAQKKRPAPPEEAPAAATAARPAGEPGGFAADPLRVECRARAKELIRQAENYHRKYPDDATVSLSDLAAAGLVPEPPRCPAGGRYVIYRDGERFEVECLNVNGTGHGTVRTDD